MIGLHAMFWIFIFLFAIVGATRGWAKELLVTFAVILAVFMTTVLENYVPVVGPMIQSDAKTGYWIKTGLMAALVFFGYQSPSLSRFAGVSNRFVREKLQDSLLGFVLGGVNAYLFVGCLLYYLHQAHASLNAYPLPFLSYPDPGSEIGIAYASLIDKLPPVWLNGITVYIAVAVAFAFVLIVFL